jgi:hypothetical protein
MTYFTIFALFSIAGELLEEPITFNSLEECGKHMETLAYLPEMKDVDMFCIKSEIASSSIRPKHRP